MWGRWDVDGRDLDRFLDSWMLLFQTFELNVFFNSGSALGLMLLSPGLMLLISDSFRLSTLWLNALKP
jgi:hypothetical protein